MINLKTKYWEIENIDTILFDKDGTFIDLHYFWGKMTELRAREIVNRFSLDSDVFKELCFCLGYDVNTGRMYSDGITALYSRSKIIEIFKSDLLKFDVNLSTNELENLFDYVSQQFYRDMLLYTKPIVSAVDFIYKIKSHGIKTGIVTSDSKESTDITIEQFGWTSLFDVVVGRESSSFTKESGEPTKLALRNLCANPKTTVMIGDAPMDSLSAQNAGIEKTILVATGQIGIDELKRYSHYTVSSLDLIGITSS